jgi:hypothetical protein
MSRASSGGWPGTASSSPVMVGRPQALGAAFPHGRQDPGPALPAAGRIHADEPAQDDMTRLPAVPGGAAAAPPAPDPVRHDPLVPAVASTGVQAQAPRPPFWHDWSPGRSAKESWRRRSHLAGLKPLLLGLASRSGDKGRREGTARGHRRPPHRICPWCGKGQPPDQGCRILAGSAGERGCWCPASGVLLPGCPAVASDFAAATAAQARFLPARRSAQGAPRVRGGR